MFLIDEYLKPETMEEAYNLLNSRKKAFLVGGGAWLRMGSRNGRAIDLSRLGLDGIHENEENVEIGAMVTFRQLEKSQVLLKNFDGILPKAVKNIVGVQLRNVVTVGGTVFSKFGFSDLLTALLVLDCRVKLYKNGEIPLEIFLVENKLGKDILEKIIIKKENLKASFQAMRNSAGDYALLNAAVSKKEHQFKVAVGARLERVMLAKNAVGYANSSLEAKMNPAEVGKLAADELEFGSNSLASEEYRKEICSVLVKRAVMEVLE